jgi:metallophosphoesterase superfamily enzyme
MQVNSLHAEEIKARAAAIRLPAELLGRLAEMAPSTAHRALAGAHDTRMSTMAKMTNALIAEERRLLEHLIVLHGQPGGARE